LYCPPEGPFYHSPTVWRMGQVNCRNLTSKIRRLASSPEFEEIREDLMRFLLQKTSRGTEMKSDGEIADMVDIVGILKRDSTTDETFTNGHSIRLPRDLKKIRSKLSEQSSGASVEEASRIVVDPKT